MEISSVIIKKIILTFTTKKILPKLNHKVTHKSNYNNNQLPQFRWGIENFYKMKKKNINWYIKKHKIKSFGAILYPPNFLHELLRIRT